jgi:hypothetical protein
VTRRKVRKVYFSDDEYASVAQAAAEEHRDVSDWIRAQALKTAKRHLGRSVEFRALVESIVDAKLNASPRGLPQMGMGTP